MTITDKVLIHASREKVWEVLTNTTFIKQWDDVPESFTHDRLFPGAILEWEGHAKMTVTTLDKQETLVMNLFLPKVELPADKYNVNYVFRLRDKDGNTELEFEIGDFSPLPNAQDYYDSSLEFVANGKQKIRELAESL